MDFTQSDYDRISKPPATEQQTDRGADSLGRLDGRDETKAEKIARWERDGIIVRGCKGCELLFDNPDQMAPRHNASERCESGKRPHCTCDTCF